MDARIFLFVLYVTRNIVRDTHESRINNKSFKQPFFRLKKHSVAHEHNTHSQYLPNKRKETQEKGAL